MIIYDLGCENEHRFEGWFRSGDDFSRQRDSGLIHCPQCDSNHIRRLPSCVAIGGHAPSEGVGATKAGKDIRAASIAKSGRPPAGTEMLAVYRQFVDALQHHSEDVGNEFANEARRIQAHEAPERLIRGQASLDECEQLRDEGIDILILPSIKEDDLN
ncbi:MAG: DUF1178 family protein [Dechloromonas sp.]|nr:DUF1178 family protein [Dechloromonas sp.]